MNAHICFLFIVILAGFGLAGFIDMRVETVKECERVVTKMYDVPEVQKNKLITECINR